jgi:hypothetical protein
MLPPLLLPSFLPPQTKAPGAAGDAIGRGSDDEDGPGRKVRRGSNQAGQVGSTEPGFEDVVARAREVVARSRRNAATMEELLAIDRELASLPLLDKIFENSIQEVEKEVKFEIGRLNGESSASSQQEAEYEAPLSQMANGLEEADIDNDPGEATQLEGVGFDDRRGIEKLKAETVEFLRAVGDAPSVPTGSHKRAQNFQIRWRRYDRTDLTIRAISSLDAVLARPEAAADAGGPSNAVLPAPPAAAGGENTALVVGRASELDVDGVRELSFYLVYWPPMTGRRRRRRYEWKDVRAMTETSDELFNAFQALSQERRGVDPSGKGWQIEITSALGEGGGRKYLVTWTTWDEGNNAPLSKRREFRALDQIVYQEMAIEFDAAVQAEVGLDDAGSDNEGPLAPVPAAFAESMNMNSETEPDRTAKAPSSTRWDPSTGTARLSASSSVRNHACRASWTLDAFEEYTITRKFVLYSRVPPASGEDNSPTKTETEQLQEDLFYILGPPLLAKWKRARVAEQRRRRLQDANNENEDDEEGEDGDYDEEEVYNASPEEAENNWRQRTKRELLDEVLGRWASSRVAIAPQLVELDAQLVALRAIRTGLEGAAATLADDRVEEEAFRQSVAAAAPVDNARANTIIQAWVVDGGSALAQSVAQPKLKLPDIRDYLSGNRSETTKAWLRLQREAHSNASAAERRLGPMGSILGSTWPFSGVPTPTQAPGEHIVPIEWHSPCSSLILETRDGTQNPVAIAIALLEENSAKGSLPIGNFNVENERKGKFVYTADGLSEAKLAAIARTIAYTCLSYVGLSNKTTSKGVAALSRSCGVERLARAMEFGSLTRYALQTTPSQWERRIQLLNLALHWQVGNAFCFYRNLSESNELRVLLQKRLKGTDDLLNLFDEALRNSILMAPK